MKQIFSVLALMSVLLISNNALAQATAEDALITENSTVIAGFDWFLNTLVISLESVLFYEIFGFPILVLWLIIGGIFFTLWLGFPNLHLFCHALTVVRGKYSKDTDPGEITHFQALSAALSGTVGLGNIAGVAIAVTLGGPGAVIWMMIAGFFGMSTKFAEVTMGHKYRVVDRNGKVSGGAFRYLREGLTEQGHAKIGRILAFIFAIFCIGGALGGGNMFQSSQSVKMLAHTYAPISGYDWAVALTLALMVGLVLIGGVRRIATTAEAIVPFMTIVYVFSAIIVLIVNAPLIPAAVNTMFYHAFTPEAAGGGMIGAIIMGFRRAAFSNEAGVGSAPIVHAPAKTTEPVRAGTVALLEPFIDTIVICFMTGLVIVVTGVYTGDQNFEPSMKGVLLTGAAFATVISWFPMLLSLCVMLFAFSTMITWSYYGERAWAYLFKGRYVTLYYIIFCTATFLGGTTDRVAAIVSLSDLLLLSMAVPNLIGLYILSRGLRAEVKSYKRRLKAGEFPITH